MRPRAAEDEGAQAIDKIRSQTIVLDEKAHVDRAVERIENQIGVDVPGQFAANDTPAQSIVGFPPARP